jgi:hypothetical protein
MITIAAKDLPGDTKIFEICSKYMNQLVAELSVGKKCDVEAVEALLLLAEWEPQSALSDVKEVGCGEEDLAAWMHVGLALRIGYYLRIGHLLRMTTKSEWFIIIVVGWLGLVSADQLLW